MASGINEEILMAAWPSWSKITVDSIITSVPSQFKSWISSLFSGILTPLNQFGQAVQFALSGQLTVTDNFMNVRYPSSGYTTIATASNYTTHPETFNQIVFPWTFWNSKQPDNVTLRIFATNNSIITGATTPSWNTDISGNIVIQFIPGLANNTKYEVYFIVT